MKSSIRFFLETSRSTSITRTSGALPSDTTTWRGRIFLQQANPISDINKKGHNIIVLIQGRQHSYLLSHSSLSPFDPFCRIGSIRRAVESS